jgi:hypothetical protein
VWTSAVAGTVRFLTEELTGDIARRVSDGVLRAPASMRSPTPGGPPGASRPSSPDDDARSRWDALEPAWRAALERYRIGEGEWDKLRAAPISKDIDLVEPATIADQELRTRFLELAHSSRISRSSCRTSRRAPTSMPTSQGHLLGELLRSSPLMFKTFTVSASCMRHGGRMVEQSGAGGKLGYLLSVVVPVTVMGVFAQQLYEIANGRDPRPMDPRTPEGRALWGQGFVKGGGASIIGDLAG